MANTYYRIKLINTKTGESRLTTITFRSKKKASEWAEEFKSVTPNSDVEIIKF